MEVSRPKEYPFDVVFHGLRPRSPSKQARFAVCDLPTNIPFLPHHFLAQLLICHLSDNPQDTQPSTSFLPRSQEEIDRLLADERAERAAEQPFNHVPPPEHVNSSDTRFGEANQPSPTRPQPLSLSDPSFLSLISRGSPSGQPHNLSDEGPTTPTTPTSSEYVHITSALRSSSFTSLLPCYIWLLIFSSSTASTIRGSPLPEPRERVKPRFAFRKILIIPP